MKWPIFLENVKSGDFFKGFSKPTITIPSGSNIFTIGSCFARNIEDILQDRFNFPVLSFQGRREEYDGERSRGILNKFTPLTIKQELDWLLEARENFIDVTVKTFCYQKTDDLVVDLGLRQYKPVTFERFIERRRQIYSVYSEVASVEAAIITLGNLEQWFYLDSPVEHAPTDRVMLRDQQDGKFQFVLHSPEEVFDQVGGIIKTLEKINPTIQIIFSVSPVPMERTFQDRHIVLSNFEGKIALVLAAKKQASMRTNVHYFPSYEMVTALGPLAMESDWRHVKNKIVEAVSDQFVRFTSY
jgi:hypothetical protein